VNDIYCIVCGGQGNSVLENHHWRCLVGYLKCSRMCDHFATADWSVHSFIHLFIQSFIHSFIHSLGI